MYRFGFFFFPGEYQAQAKWYQFEVNKLFSFKMLQLQRSSVGVGVLHSADGIVGHAQGLGSHFS